MRIDRLSAVKWWIGHVRSGTVTRYVDPVYFLGTPAECTVARDRVKRVAVQVY